MHALLAEFYLPRRGTDLAGLARRARATAEQSRRTGPAVHFINVIHVPEDESGFAIYEADSAGAVAAAGSRAGIVFDRIVEVTTSDANDAGEAG